MALGDEVPTTADRPAALARYERLMSLTVRHDFYGEGAPCSDFTITPTAATQTLLQNLRLLAKPRPGGIDILYSTRNAPAMLRYLWSHRNRRRAEKDDLPSVGRGSWSRLAFTFTLGNPLFTNFTDMPLGVRPGKHCLYVSNQTAKVRDGQISLEVDPSKFSEMQNIIFSPTHLRIEVPPGSARVVVRGTSGRAILLAKPLPAPGAQPRPATAASHPARAASPPNTPARKHEIPTVPIGPGGGVELDMTNHPPGIYSYEVTAKDGSSIVQKKFLYAGISDAPLLMLDLFLASPDGEPADSGKYPIRVPEQLPADLVTAKSLLDPAPQHAAQDFITTCDYELRFAARKTIWTYYIVLPPESTATDGLSIVEEPPGAQFDGPGPVDRIKVPTDRPACSFTARTGRALQSRPDVSLRLRGTGMPGNGSARTLLERLPLPSAETISILQTPDGEQAVSEVYVYL